jgi:hypothetical protein
MALVAQQVLPIALLQPTILSLALWGKIKFIALASLQVELEVLLLEDIELMYQQQQRIS